MREADNLKFPDTRGHDPDDFATGLSGRQAGLVACEECDKVFRYRADVAIECDRCGAELHQRIPNSLARTWALLITSAIMFIPANVYTIMNVSYFGVDDPSTIMGGVILLVQMGSYPVAFVVFVASVIVPLFKIIGIFMILLSLTYKLNIRDRQRITMFRFIEFIGRWSMLDIFVISILAALVSIGGLSGSSLGGVFSSLKRLCFLPLPFLRVM